MVQSHSYALLPLKCYPATKTLLIVLLCTQDSSGNYSLFSLLPDYSWRVQGVGGHAGAAEMPRIFSPSVNRANVRVQIQIWENEQINWIRFASASLRLHSGHVISCEQAANVWAPDYYPWCCWHVLGPAAQVLPVISGPLSSSLIIRKLTSMLLGFFFPKVMCAKSTNELWLPLPLWRSITFDIQRHKFHRQFVILGGYFWFNSS